MTKEFEKKFWKEALQDPYAIVVGGTCLHIGSETDSDAWGGAFRGFGGAKFKFEILKDTMMWDKGTILESTNVWYRGDIPDDINVENNAKLTDDSPTKLITKESRK